MNDRLTTQPVMAGVGEGQFAQKMAALEAKRKWLYRAQSIRDFISRNSRRRPQAPLDPAQVAKEAL